MESVEAKIGNTKKPLFDSTDPEIVYCSTFETPEMLKTAC